MNKFSIIEEYFTRLCFQWRKTQHLNCECEMHLVVCYAIKWQDLVVDWPCWILLFNLPQSQLDSEDFYLKTPRCLLFSKFYHVVHSVNTLCHSLGILKYRKKQLCVIAVFFKLFRNILVDIYQFLNLSILTSTFVSERMKRIGVDWYRS